MSSNDNKAHWEKLVDERFALGYNKLTSDERLWYNIQALILATRNRGLFGLYYNSNVSIQDTIDDLKSLNSNVAVILEDFNKIFPDSNPPDDTDERNKILDSLDKQVLGDSLKKADSRLTDNLEELEKKLRDFIIKNRIV